MVSKTHPKHAEYSRRSYMRQGILALATLEGWQRLDVLEAFVRPDGSVIVIDTDNRRYVTGELPPLSEDEAVQPAERPGSATEKKTKLTLVPKLPSVGSEAEKTWNQAVDAVREGDKPLAALAFLWKKKIETAKHPEDYEAFATFVDTISDDAPDWREALPKYL